MRVVGVDKRGSAIAYQTTPKTFLVEVVAHPIRSPIRYRKVIHMVHLVEIFRTGNVEYTPPVIVSIFFYL